MDYLSININHHIQRLSPHIKTLYLVEGYEKANTLDHNLKELNISNYLILTTNGILPRVVSIADNGKDKCDKRPKVITINQLHVVKEAIKEEIDPEEIIDEEVLIEGPPAYEAIAVKEEFDDEMIIEPINEELEETIETIDSVLETEETSDEEIIVEETIVPEIVEEEPRGREILQYPIKKKRISRKEHICSKCNRIFEFSSQLRGHFSRCGKTATKTNFECGCGLNFGSSLRYREHLYETDGMCKTCPQCHKTYQMMVGIKKHYKYNPSHRPKPPSVL